LLHGHLELRLREIVVVDDERGVLGWMNRGEIDACGCVIADVVCLLGLCEAAELLGVATGTAPAGDGKAGVNEVR
jgi:hypothetical protein